MELCRKGFIQFHALYVRLLQDPDLLVDVPKTLVSLTDLTLVLPSARDVHSFATSSHARVWVDGGRDFFVCGWSQDIKTAKKMLG